MGSLFVMRQHSKAPEETAAASAAESPTAAQTPQANNSATAVLPAAAETPADKAPIVSSPAASPSQPAGPALLNVSGTNTSAAEKAAHET